MDSGGVLCLPAGYWRVYVHLSVVLMVVNYVCVIISVVYHQFHFLNFVIIGKLLFEAVYGQMKKDMQSYGLFPYQTSINP